MILISYHSNCTLKLYNQWKTNNRTVILHFYMFAQKRFYYYKARIINCIWVRTNHIMLSANANFTMRRSELYFLNLFEQVIVSRVKLMQNNFRGFFLRLTEENFYQNLLTEKNNEMKWNIHVFLFTFHSLNMNDLQFAISAFNDQYLIKWNVLYIIVNKGSGTWSFLIRSKQNIQGVEENWTLLWYNKQYDYFWVTTELFWSIFRKLQY